MGIRISDEAMSVAKKLSSEWFTPSSQEGEDDPAGFLLSPMTQDEHLEFNLLCRQETEDSSDLEPGLKRISLKPTKAASAIVFSKVTAWRNVTGEDGVDLEFSVSDFRKLIPWQDQFEIMERVIARSNLSEPEKKTS